MFTNLCLVLLLLLPGSLVPKFHFQLAKKSKREVWEIDGHSTNLLLGQISISFNQ